MTNNIKAVLGTISLGVGLASASMFPASAASEVYDVLNQQGWVIANDVSKKQALSALAGFCNDGSSFAVLREELKTNGSANCVHAGSDNSIAQWTVIKAV
jgi:hypothetical protein